MENIRKTERELNSRLKILTIIKNKKNHDFSLYKESTINRRLERRMSIHRIDTLTEYLHYIENHPDEVNILFNEFLINVTSFFRDYKSFEPFKDKLKTEVLDKKNDGDNIYIWIPGCSTGEEAYSLAIILQEYIEESEKNLNIQILGTDIDENAIKIAISAIYPDKIAKDINPKLLDKFFTKKEEDYVVKENIMKNVKFKPLDVLLDHPPLKCDVISCRNVLIYMNRDAQKKILSTFNYALKPGSILFLGPSESINDFRESFITLDHKWKIFKSKKVKKEYS